MREFSRSAIFHRLSPRRRGTIVHRNAHAFGMWPQRELRMKTIALSLLAMLTVSAAAGAAPPSARSVSLPQEPLIMRLNKDEFRIAFGINGERCGANGCNGMIRYRVDWQTADGTRRSETKNVNYSVPPRTIAVDRRYFDPAEGQQTTDVVKVSVDAIPCLDGVDARH